MTDSLGFLGGEDILLSSAENKLNQKNSMLQTNSDAHVNNLSLNLSSMGLSGGLPTTGPVDSSSQQNSLQTIPAMDVDDLNIVIKYPKVTLLQFLFPLIISSFINKRANGVEKKFHVLIFF